MFDTIVFILQALACVAFSLSGTIAAIIKKADAVGAFVLSMTTVFGGGLIRDIILGITPPALFTDRNMLIFSIISGATALIAFHLAFLTPASIFIMKHKNDFILNLLDAIGLSIFVVTGAKSAIDAGFADNYPLIVFAGVVTGTGGGILRDTLSNEIPLVFRKHIYMLPVIGGCIIYIILAEYVGGIISMIIPMAVIITLRILAIIFKWNLPIPGGKEKK